MRRSADVRLRAPLPDPPTVRDFMTFEQHVEGVARLAGDRRDVPERWYEAPASTSPTPTPILGPYDDVPVPPGSRLFDLELEVAAVIGRAGRDVHPDEARRLHRRLHDPQRLVRPRSQFAEMQVRLGPTKGKDSATTLGPWLVTPDELEPWRTDDRLRPGDDRRINGVVVGEDRLSSMAFSFADLVAYASRGTEVRPGDVLGSGTCGGGCLAELWGRHGFDAHPPLAAGDVVTVSVEAVRHDLARVVGGVDLVPIPRARRGR